MWAELASDDEEAPPGIIAAPLTVGEGDDDAVIPATDGGSIRDYLFDADVTTGGTTITFTNSSDNQFRGGGRGGGDRSRISGWDKHLRGGASALCFIHDREGGLPHAFQHGMYDVFQVG